MNATSASPADPSAVDWGAAPPAAAQGAGRVRIWDAPVRVFHWLAVLSFAGAWITAESERWRLLHVSLGYTLAGLVAFRLVWGLVGTRHARFANFVRGPRAVAAYLRGLVRGEPVHTPGHNPAGALAIVAMLGLTLLIAASGWATYNDLWGGALEDLHEGAANAMLAVVIVHIAGVLIASRLHHENLVRAMVTGFKPASAHLSPADGIRSAWRSVAVLMLAAVLGFWVLQWQAAPQGGLGLLDRAPAAGADGQAGYGGDSDRDHDREDD